MRIRIIAYGVGVLAVLLGVSVLTFWAMRPRPYQLPDVDFVEQVMAADAETRKRLLDDVLEAHRVAMTIYAADGELVASNVEPPLKGEDLSSRSSVEADPAERPPLRVGPPIPPLAPARVIDAHVASIPFAPVGEQRLGLPAVLRVEGATIVTQPLPPEGSLLSFATPLLVTLAGLVLLSFPVTAAMTRKLDALAETARRFGEGDLSQRAETSLGSEELNRTAKAFNRMAERITELRQRERVLLANVSHELRTPMARMAVLLELSQTNPTQATRYQRELGRDLRELEALLERITETFFVELASPRAREHRLAHRALTDLREVASGAATEFRAGAFERELSLELPDGPVLREEDEILVRRAIANLLDNARKYSRGPAPIVLTVGPAGEVVVSDAGEGISPEDLPHVFEPFFRADRSRDRKTGGVGLGLGFVRMVARLHGGDVSVESTPGCGCTFRVTLGPGE